MKNIKKFQFSCKIFWGFQVDIDVNDCNNLEDIIEFAIVSLDSFLLSNNLINLIEKRRTIPYHIHTASFEELKTNNIKDDSEVDAYICGHTNNCT